MHTWMKGDKYVIPDDQGWLNVLFSINQSVSHHNIMLLLPYVSQLSNVTSQLKDIYGLALVGAQLLVMIMMTCGIDLPRRSSNSI